MNTIKNLFILLLVHVMSVLNGYGQGLYVGTTEGVTAVSPTGGATYTIPIEIRSGMSDFCPKISLLYNSQGGNDIAGYGWGISGLSAITATFHTIYYDGYAGGIHADANDAYSIDGKRMFVKKGFQNGTIDSEYVTESEMYSKIRVTKSVSGTNKQTPFAFVVQTSDGSTLTYGGKNNAVNTVSRFAYTWLVDSVKDINGNGITYEYVKYNGISNISKISYGYNIHADNPSVACTIDFTYENRPDTICTYVNNIVMRHTKRLKKIECRYYGTLYRTYTLSYEQATGGFSHLVSVQESGSDNKSFAPTTFTWQNLPTFKIKHEQQNVSMFYDDKPNDMYMFSGDLDNDGRTELIGLSLKSEVLNNRVSHYTGVSVYAHNDKHGTLLMGEKQYKASAYIDSKVLSSKPEGGVVAHLSTGSNNSIVLPYYESDPGGKYIYYELPIEGLSFCSKLDFTSEMPCTHIADLNMDGVDEFLHIEKKTLSDGKVRLEQMYVDVEKKTRESKKIDLYPAFTDTQKKDKICNSLCADFNGDGLSDIMLLLNNSSLILWNDDGEFSSSNISSYTNIVNPEIVRVGDFNGDGLADLLFNKKSSCIWDIAFNKGGKNFTLVSVPYLQSKNVQKQGDKDSIFSCIVHDFNGDGASDIVVGHISNNVHRTIWLESNRDKTFIVRKDIAASKTNTSTKNIHVLQGDFNRDGISDILCYGGNLYTGNCTQEKTWILYSGDGIDASSNKITTVIAGLGKKTSFHYGLLTDNYTYSTDLTYPLVEFNYPISVVRSVTVSAGDTAYKSEHRYAGGVLHLQGKGFLGFTELETKKDGISTKRTFELNKEYYVPYLSSELSTDSIGEDITRNTYEYEFLPAENNIIHSFAQNLVRTSSVDKISKISKITSYSDYIYGKPSFVKTEGAEVCEQTFTYKNVTNNGKWILGLPLTSTKKVRNFCEKTVCTYDIDNRLYRKSDYISTVSSSDLNLIGTETFSYDACGHVVSQKQTFYDASSDILTTLYAYDNKGRLCKKTSPKGLSYSYYYNTTGQICHEADDFKCHKYIYFDGMGRVARSVKRLIAEDNSYKDEETTYAYTAEKKGNCVCKVTVTSPNEPTRTERYDAFGRKVMIGEVHFDGKEYVTENKYISENLIGFVSTPHIYGSTTNVGTTTSYDSFLRPLQIIDPDGMTTLYTYSDGQVVTSIAGKKITETFNADGKVISRKDNGGTVLFEYTPFGDYRNINLVPRKGGTSGITYSYDKYARLISYTDPGGVTKKYTYDKWGNKDAVISASGIADKFVYNKFGELVKRIYIPADTTEMQTDYTYDAKHQLVSEHGNNYQYNYVYDTNGRLLQEDLFVNVNTDSSRIKRIYSYDEGEKLKSVTNKIEGEELAIVERREYTRGWLSAVSVNGKSVWQRISEDNMGYVNCVKDLYGKQNITFDKIGNITSLSINGDYDRFLEERTYQYDNKRRLTSDNGKTVSYDIMRRLTGWGDKAYKYDAWGNITKVGCQESVTYDKMRLIDVTTPDPKVWGTDEQYAAYNSMSRPYKVYNDKYKTYFHYNADGDRIATVKYDWSAIPPIIIKPNTSEAQEENTNFSQETISPYPGVITPDMNRAFESIRLYVGDSYETYRERSQTKYHLYYIGGSSSTAPAVYIINNGTATLHMLYRDRLGSIIAKVSDSEIETFDYDPWGCLTINGKECDNSEALKKVFIRGYLGQEHIGRFGLINLNARLYNPYAGRFLSPDPITDFSVGMLGFNNYAYCHNNPFSYTDPNGEFAWAAVAISALVGGSINLCMNWGNIESFWQGMAYFGTGAAIGGLSSAAIVLSPVGIAGGLLYGAATGGLSGGLLEGINSCLGGGNFWNGFNRGSINGMITGGLFGAVSGYYSAVEEGANIWTGKRTTMTPVSSESLVRDIETAIKEGGTSEGQFDASKLPREKHHFATNINKKYTPEMKKITDKYGLSLDGSWNKEVMPHRGCHPHAYHDFVLKQMDIIDNMPNMNAEIFQQEFRIRVINPVLDNPEMLRKSYWLRTSDFYKKK